jgi:hypothetical protein
MKTTIALIIFGMVPSTILASDPDRVVSMEQRQTPVEAMRVAIRKLRPEMSIEEVQRILGVNLGFGIWDRQGIASWQITMPFQRDYELSVRYESDLTSTRLTSVELKHGDRIIAKMRE